jgi:hypothetical protein
MEKQIFIFFCIVKQTSKGPRQQNPWPYRKNQIKLGQWTLCMTNWLTQFLFDSIEEVQEYATRLLWTYNHERPNMGLGGITPIQKLAMVASEWIPDDSLTDSSGSVSNEYLWAVLDCPGA